MHCLSSTRLQVAAPLTWSASLTSTPSTPSSTTWSWSARSTAHWLAHGRTHSWPKVHRLLHYCHVAFQLCCWHECVRDVHVNIECSWVVYIHRLSYLSLQKSLFMLPTSLVRSLLWKLTSCTSYPACTPPLGKHQLCYSVIYNIYHNLHI